MKSFRVFFISLLLSTASVFAGTATFEAQPSPTLEEETSHDVFSYETTYTFRSDFKESKLGHVHSLFNDFSYDHRFLITGRWYFRTGVEYQRYDFGGTDNGLPDHLQAAMAHVAVEYVVKDHAGAGIAIDPGFGFGKTLAHNLALLANTTLFHGLGVPLLIGASRKRFIQGLSGGAEPAPREPGSHAAAAAAAAQGAQILRVHDVAGSRQALAVWRASVFGTEN